MRPKPEIEKTEMEAAMLDMTGSKWPGMSYESGVSAALRWVLDDDEPSPLEE